MHRVREFVRACMRVRVCVSLRVRIIVRLHMRVCVGSWRACVSACVLVF